MDNYISCPECSSLAVFNIHFGAYFCNACDWFDNSYNKQRVVIASCDNKMTFIGKPEVI